MPEKKKSGSKESIEKQYRHWRGTAEGVQLISEQDIERALKGTDGKEQR